MSLHLTAPEESTGNLYRAPLDKTRRLRGRLSLSPKYRECPHNSADICQYPIGQPCIIRQTSTSTCTDCDTRLPDLPPHFINNTIRGRYDQSIEEIYTAREADAFVKSLWCGLFDTVYCDEILDSKIEMIVNTAVRQQPRKALHPNRNQVIEVYDRVLLARNLPSLMKVAKDMIRAQYWNGQISLLERNNHELRKWRRCVANALGWSLIEEEHFEYHGRFSPSARLR